MCHDQTPNARKAAQESISVSLSLWLLGDSEKAGAYGYMKVLDLKMRSSSFSRSLLFRCCQKSKVKPLCGAALMISCQDAVARKPKDLNNIER